MAAKVIDFYTVGESTGWVVSRGPDPGKGSNNAGHPGMCDHGTIGAAVTPAYGNGLAGSVFEESI